MKFLKNSILKVNNKFKSRIDRAMGTPESKKKRIRRFLKILFFASASVSLMFLLSNFPMIKKLLLKGAFKVKSTLPGSFLSQSSESENLVEDVNLSKSNKRLIKKLGVIIASSIIILSVGKFMEGDLQFKFDVAEKEVIETRNPTVDESSGVGPATWHPAARLLVQEIIRIFWMIKLIEWGFDDSLFK